MRIGAIPESLVERVALALDIAPTPLVETHAAATLARAISAGVELGVFEALAGGPLAGPQVAERCQADPGSIELLLQALAASGYLTCDGERRYALTRRSRRWLLAASPRSVRDKLLLQRHEWAWLDGLETFARTGRPLDFHRTMTPTERGLYHRSMRVLARYAAREIAWRTPVPKGARRMLDLGGSHGHFAAALCRRHPRLAADVLDLPDAVAAAAPLLAAEGLGERLRHRAADALSCDLGAERYDLVLMSNLAHHFDAGENAKLMERIARALRPDGWLVVQEPVRQARAGRNAQAGALLGLYFALQSRPGVRTWTCGEIAAWQQAAGLKPTRAARLILAPGWVQQRARKVAAVTSARARRSPAGPALAPAE